MRTFFEKVFLFCAPLALVSAILIALVGIQQPRAVQMSAGVGGAQREGAMGASPVPAIPEHTATDTDAATVDVLSTTVPKRRIAVSSTRKSFPEVLGEKFLSVDEKDALLRLHNAERKKEGVAPLSWSPYLAESAEAWANTLASRGCVLEHSENGYGENIFYGEKYGSEQTPYSPVEVMSALTDEREDYSHEMNSCVERSICGHYTQIVWANTERVGCAKSLCLSDEREEIWVCHYDPPGNVVGQSPY